MVSVAETPCPRCRRGLDALVEAQKSYWICRPCGARWRQGPTPRWYPLKYHPVQARLLRSKSRICVIGAGRRSGKTERAKRRGVLAAGLSRRDNMRVAFMAPTREHARDVYWDDLQLLVPDHWIRAISESRLTIKLKNGALIQVLGLDRPRRIAGFPLDWAFVDEMGDQKPDAWETHIAPALETPNRLGRAWLYGVTRPGGNFRHLRRQALDPSIEDMEWFHWRSDEILTKEQIRRAKARYDERTYAQEFDAQFVFFEGRVYYNWDTSINGAHRLQYDPHGDLLLFFDFGTRPGVANVAQEQEKRFYQRQAIRMPEYVADVFTAGLSEVHIPRDSRTPQVIRALLALELNGGPRVHQHKGLVHCYGDVAGGAGHSSQTEGSDWEIIEGMLGRVFGDRLYIHKGHDDKHNPTVVARTNATCARIKDADGVVRYLVDPVSCPETILDYEEVSWKKGVREIEKDPEVPRTHHSDAGDYFFERVHPIGGAGGWWDDPLEEYDLGPWS